MRVLDWESIASSAGRGEALDRPLAATVGVFDGLHLGHQKLIERVLGHPGLEPALFTFRENPKRLFAPASYHGELCSLDQRLGLIAEMGVELCVLIDFSGDFSKLPGRRFLSILRENAGLRFLAIGSDFRCGYRLDTDAEVIREFCARQAIGFQLIEPVSWGGHRVSSSRIRKAIVEGRLEEAAAMLGRGYELELSGAKVEGGRLLLGPSGQVLPPEGSYEAEVRMDGVWRPVVAEQAPRGAWRLSPLAGEARAPAALRLLRLASRE